MYPTFIVIGPGRTGTSTLYEVFREHPEVAMAENTKETNYFDLNYEKGIEWYMRFFRNAPFDARAVGEISTTYFYNDEVPARIRECCPDVRFFSILRSPFDRLRSVYYYRKRAGTIPKGVEIGEALEHYPDLQRDNDYADHLEQFLKFFEREQLLVLSYDDLIAGPERFLEDLLRHLGVDPTFRSETIYERMNAASEMRISGLAGLSALTGNVLRGLGLHGVATRLKRSQLVRSIFLKPVEEGLEPSSSTWLPEEWRQRLQDRWRPQLRRTEQITGLWLQHWLEQ